MIGRFWYWFGLDLGSFGFGSVWFGFRTENRFLGLVLFFISNNLDKISNISSKISSNYNDSVVLYNSDYFRYFK